VDYILSITGNPQLSYVGHSQGTTQAFAAFSSNPILAKKIAAFAALAPVTRVGHLSNKLLQLLADIDPALLLKLLGVNQFLGPNAMPFPINKAIELICYAGIFSFNRNFVSK
jgi:pimeloyl-ACP methyl ester carboxylesterase